MEEFYCPYCGDELDNKKEIKYQDKYYKEHGVCSHWDTEKQWEEF